MVAAAGSTIEKALARLAASRAIFHSEADFQHALAWQLQLDHPAARIRLETRPVPARPLFLDLLADVDGQRIAVELKYLVRGVATTWKDEAFELRDQSAQDVRRYDVVKDISRLEEVVAVGVADAGVMVALSNDARYWSEGRPGSVDAAFRLQEGRALTGTLAWAPHAGEGTTRSREKELRLSGTYPVRWRNYSDVGGTSGRFRYLLLEVERLAELAPVESGPAPAETPTPRVGAAAPSEGSSTVGGYERTCREEILDSMVALERRHGRNAFSPAEILAEVRSRGDDHQDSMRAHVVSAMCVNAPPNHAVRYPDLERVGRGLYRRIASTPRGRRRGQHAEPPSPG